MDGKDDIKQRWANELLFILPEKTLDNYAVVAHIYIFYDSNKCHNLVVEYYQSITL